jgi:hypothetical protein
VFEMVISLGCSGWIHEGELTGARLQGTAVATAGAAGYG